MTILFKLLDVLTLLIKLSFVLKHRLREASAEQGRTGFPMKIGTKKLRLLTTLPQIWGTNKSNHRG